MPKHVHCHHIRAENNECRRRLVISQWNTAQSAFTNFIKSYECIKIWPVVVSNKGEVNDFSVLMTKGKLSLVAEGFW